MKKEFDWLWMAMAIYIVVTMIAVGLTLNRTHTIPEAPKNIETIEPMEKIVPVIQTKDRKNSVQTTSGSSAILDKINATRAEVGLGRLGIAGALMSSARAKAEHMVANDYWAHVAPNGTTPWYFITQYYGNYSLAGENLAKGWTNWTDQHNGWVNSPSHYAVMVSDVTDFGYFVTEYKDGNTLVVTHFGRK